MLPMQIFLVCFQSFKDPSNNHILHPQTCTPTGCFQPHLHSSRLLQLFLSWSSSSNCQLLSLIRKGAVCMIKGVITLHFESFFGNIFLLFFCASLQPVLHGSDWSTSSSSVIRLCVVPKALAAWEKNCIMAYVDKMPLKSCKCFPYTQFVYDLQFYKTLTFNDTDQEINIKELNPLPEDHGKVSSVFRTQLTSS